MYKPELKCYLPCGSWVDIQFQDLTYTVPQGKRGPKLILRSVNGHFKPNQLTAILGPSGSGKSTLLNVLAGYKCGNVTGEMFVNGKSRNLKVFQGLSRYIMQENLMQPMLTVDEAMMVAANLKLGVNLPLLEKQKMISNILDLLGLNNSTLTECTKLSGGEKKRLSIALELLNNPPVLLLDEPTTGLDDLSCMQCVLLLKRIAQGGRTVICSIHTPSARMFSVFDNVFILSSGQCIYQGFGPDVVPYLASVGLDCPRNFNPADFIIEIACKEYGDFQDKLVSAIDNGKVRYTCKYIARESVLAESQDLLELQILDVQDNSFENQKCGWVTQFTILLMRMWKQMWRDKSYLLLRTILHILVGCLMGTLYLGMGKDGSKTVFNFGLYFTCLIFFMYIPMMPVLLQFPKEYQLIKREHFNKWYRLSAYFSALTASTLPTQIVLGSLYLTLVYVLTDQPMELGRIGKFYFICILTGTISESLGLLIASQFSLMNSMFLGPVIAVPFMLLAVYGFGSGYDSIPPLIKFAMHFSYLRYSLQGLMATMMTNRERLKCPDEVEICVWTDLEHFMEDMGMENTKLWLDITALVAIYFLFRGGFYYLLKQRLSPNKTFIALRYIGQIIKSRIAR
ncbi:ATP-binding cassette subfamily G member 4-like [Euwallacea similis]|uniref:ATP-binding cassette subfamily G member 4-like n=1 Tax=Euwallacea similis TaxID=1736056 RepID=UPI00344F6CE9